MGVWNYKEMVHTRDIKQAFSDRRKPDVMNERNPQGGSVLIIWEHLNASHYWGETVWCKLMLMEVNECEGNTEEKVTCVWHKLRQRLDVNAFNERLLLKNYFCKNAK